VVGFTTGSRGKVPGKTCEKRRRRRNNNSIQFFILIIIILPADYCFPAH
jgi:hypothetical protein